MPLYDYECDVGENVQEALIKRDEHGPNVCTNCGSIGTLTRLEIGHSNFILKGSGWGKDLYVSSKEDRSSTNK